MSITSLAILRLLYRKTQPRGCKFVYRGAIHRTVLPKDRIVSAARQATSDTHPADGQTSESACARSSHKSHREAAAGPGEWLRQVPASRLPADEEYKRPHRSVPGATPRQSAQPRCPAARLGRSPAPWLERSRPREEQIGMRAHHDPSPRRIAPSDDTGRNGRHRRWCRLPAALRACCNSIQA